MPTSVELYEEIMTLTSALIRLSLADEFNFPALRNLGAGEEEIGISGAVASGVGFGSVPYRDIYTDIEKAKMFNYRFLDGGLLSLQYYFKNNQLIKHRLGFWASPSYEAFQNDPEVYLSDEMYLDFLHPSIVPFPFRFDFGDDTCTEANCSIHHPRSHLSLGLYKNCRLPVCSPVTPGIFVGFVLRNFYNTPYRKYSDELNIPNTYFPQSLYAEERAIPHLVVNEI